MRYVELIALLALLQYFAFGLLVGGARGDGVKAPAVSGHEMFERIYRVQMNTLELLVLLLPALYLAATLWSPLYAAICGAVYLLGRIIYWRAYVSEPGKRTLGFALCMGPILVLIHRRAGHGDEESRPHRLREAMQSQSGKNGDVIPQPVLDDIDRLFADYALDAHVPGLAYGIVSGGRLVHSRTLGVQDLASKRPVDDGHAVPHRVDDQGVHRAHDSQAARRRQAATRRPRGRLRARDARVEISDARLAAHPRARPAQPHRRIRHRRSMGRSAAEARRRIFSALLARGVPFASPPATRMEYSNLGYAILGRIITNVSGRPYAEDITRTLLEPLGMTSCGFESSGCAPERRATGYDGRRQWSTNPRWATAHSAQWAGSISTAADYAKWVCFLVSAWPPRDDPDNGPVRRATVRELAQGSNFPALGPPRRAHDGEERRRRATTYGMGMTRPRRPRVRHPPKPLGRPGAQPVLDESLSTLFNDTDLIDIEKSMWTDNYVFAKLTRETIGKLSDWKLPSPAPTPPNKPINLVYKIWHDQTITRCVYEFGENDQVRCST